ncbi:MAG: hypothetical protein VB084_02925 [Syntrophomonadaceae bacterium]|nr:hypothetical protein [Syntrophomonadaceae bacterium]
MEEDKKSNPGAPATDTTSALFVSARKKQLQQQEEEQRAREKEEKRLEAEAEVRRLEQEVEDRKRKVEEEARKAEEEARRIAEEARARKAEAEANPDAILGKAPEAQPAGKGFNMPKIGVGKPSRDKAAPSPAPGRETAPKAQPAAGSAAKDGLAAKVDKKMIPLIGGAAAVVVIAIIAIVMLTGSGGLPSGFKEYANSEAGLTFAANENWTQGTEAWDSFYYPILGVWTADEKYGAFLVNFSYEYQEMAGEGLNGNDILGEFVYMLSDDIPDIEYVSDITYQKTDQADRYAADVNIDSRPYSASVSIYPDGSCVAALVSSSTPEDKNLQAVLDSAAVLQ